MQACICLYPTRHVPTSESKGPIQIESGEYMNPSCLLSIPQDLARPHLRVRERMQASEVTDPRKPDTLYVHFMYTFGCGPSH